MLESLIGCVMIDALERLVAVLQDQNVMVGLKVTLAFAGTAYLFRVYCKHANGIAAGLFLYPSERKYYDNMGLWKFLRMEYYLNLERVSGITPPQDVLDCYYRMFLPRNIKPK